MILTLNQALLLIITIAVVVAVVYLVRLFAQLRRTEAEGEKALARFGELAFHLQELDLVVKQEVEELGKTIAASKKAAVNVAEASSLITSNFVRPSFRYLPLILPVAQFVWRWFGKRKKERAHVK
jgi:predicted Kef-type K+ transport protein